MEYITLFNDEYPINFNVQTKMLPTKGNLVYEYNPLRNYRLSLNFYEYKNQLYSESELEDKFGISIDKRETITVTEKNDLGLMVSTELSNPGYLKNWINVPATETMPLLHEAGELVDFNTNELKIRLDHPVLMIPLYSYDGSVNLIINDGVNIPRLINSRFSATGKNTYEIVDRKGNNDTNIYDQGVLFDVDTSLYKRVTTIPKIEFKGLSSGGTVKIGNYHFYFKLADADGNESDFIGESGLVSVFIGSGSYHSVHTGLKNENSHKQVNFYISNIDSAYSYVYVYYSRYTAEDSLNLNTEYVKIDKKYLINLAGICKVIINGSEKLEEISLSDINVLYNTVDAVGSAAVCQNMLFLANVHKPDLPYTELSDLSLRFLPYLHLELYEVQLNENYQFSTTSAGYIDPKYIYEKTGYWGEELYRLGIVYILPNGTLSPVFNIRGAYLIPTYSESFYTSEPIYEEKNGTLERKYIEYDENTYYIINSSDVSHKENVKGVVSFKPTKDIDTVYGIDIRVDSETIKELKKYVKGYFFVRQLRIPTILTQGVTIGIDDVSRTPTIPISESILTLINYDNTHVTTEDVNDVNYISEGFLSRYLFEFKEQENSFWKDFGKAMLMVTAVVAAAAATVFTMGGAAVAIGMAAAVVLGTAAVTIATKEVIDELITANLKRKGKPKRKLEGRNTKPVSGHDIVETNKSRLLTDEFKERIIIKDPSKNKIQGIVCPDYTVNQAYYNLIFTGNKHLIKTTKSQCINFINGDSSNYFTNKDRHFFIPQYIDYENEKYGEFSVIGVPDNTKAVGLDSLIFRSRAGEAEEAYLFEQVGVSFKDETMDINTAKKEKNIDKVSLKQINSDIIRGAFGPYLAFNNKSNIFDPAETVNIYIPEYSLVNMDTYFNIRMHDTSSYSSISDRYDINEKSYSIGMVSQEQDFSKQYTLFRGDCYICQFTHRVNRNFNDPSAPYNDVVVDSNSWKENYDPSDTSKNVNINLGDVNAVPLGMWLTFKVRSSNNLNIRTLDGSDVEETAMSGHPKGYYPYYPMSTEGSYKQPDSGIYNKGFSKSTSARINVEVPDVPHIKNWFGTRIMYSDIHINDAYKNGFRVFQGTNYRDYTREYGEIVKLVPLESNLLVIFEHGIGIATVNERAVAARGTGGNVYINSSNVLPENLMIISDMYGTQWPESVLKVPGKTGSSAQWVYGVDTIAKKIWRTNGLSLECISDMRVQEFLNNNITLGERELTPKIGIRNVKTVYNAFKRDVLFTFYDNTYGFEEKVWNLCWNEILEKFITFYSWVPSYMENINNIPFSFNRDTSKWIAKLGTSHSGNSFSDGITLSNVITNNISVKDSHDNLLAVDNFAFNYTYVDKSGKEKTKTYNVHHSSRNNLIGVLSLSNRTLPNDLLFYNIEYSLERDMYQNYKQFDIVRLNVEKDGNSEEYTENGLLLPGDAKFAGSFVPIYGLIFKVPKDVKEFFEVYYKDENPNSDKFNTFLFAYDELDKNVYYKAMTYGVQELLSEIYYRNKKGHSYADDIHNRLDEFIPEVSVVNNLPIFKDLTGKRKTLPKDKLVNSDKIVTLLNIKANIYLIDNDSSNSLSDDYYNLKAGLASGSSLIDAGYYESVVAIAPEWNLLFLSTDFWKHGQAGIIDITDDIYPTYWYGKQHPFEFEVVVVNDPSVHKIFTNLELVANKAKPESFHYEIVGEAYDFSKDKPNMYYRQEAMKALWLHNGADITYNRNFLKTQPIWREKSADFPHKYYTRQDTINEIEDYYITTTLSAGSTYDYKHLSGAEIVYYPNRQEYRIWQHLPAVILEDLPLDNPRSIISANCQYLEDKWRISINPILVCYKNENYWRRPKLPVLNSPIPDMVWEHISNNGGNVEIPEVLTDLGYNANDMDLVSWLDDPNIYGTMFGTAQNRKETDVRDRFVKVRIRYSGEELAIINFLNTIYRVSYG